MAASTPTTPAQPPKKTGYIDTLIRIHDPSYMQDILKYGHATRSLSLEAINDILLGFAEEEKLDEDHVNIELPSGFTLLHDACDQPDSSSLKETVCRSLLTAGAVGGETALFRAVSTNDVATCQILLNAGLRVETANTSGKTALHYAAETGATEVCQFLLTKGAQIDAPDSSGQTPLHYARTRAVCEVLLSHGAPIDAVDSSGKTPLHYNTRAAVCQVLLDHGAPIDALDSSGKTPLHYAAETGATEVCQFLLTKGARVDALDSSRKTPLHYAAEKDEVTAYKMLVRFGAAGTIDPGYISDGALSPKYKVIDGRLCKNPDRLVLGDLRPLTALQEGVIRSGCILELVEATVSKMKRSSPTNPFFGNTAAASSSAREDDLSASSR